MTMGYAELMMKKSGVIRSLNKAESMGMETQVPDVSIRRAQIVCPT